MRLLKSACIEGRAHGRPHETLVVQHAHGAAEEANSQEHKRSVCEHLKAKLAAITSRRPVFFLAHLQYFAATNPISMLAALTRLGFGSAFSAGYES